MGRKSKVETSIILEYIDRYRSEYPDIKIKFTDLSRYMKKDGIDVEDRIIRRNQEISDYVKTLNNSEPQHHHKTVAYYKTLDIEDMFRRCCTTEKLKKEIADRESYYREIAESAGFAFTKLRKAEDKISDLKNEIQDLSQEIVKLKEKNKQIPSLKCRNKELSSFIKNVVNPETANLILFNDGKTDDPNSPISDYDLFSADSDIGEFKNRLEEKLMKDFEQ